MIRYSLWIIPENESQLEMQQVVKKYSQQFGYTQFTPHVTLYEVSGREEQEVIEGVKQIASEIEPFELEFGDVEFSTTYFQSVFLRVKTVAHLLNAHLKLRMKFNSDDNHVYMPHISLVYGEHDMETKEEIAKEIKINSKGFKAEKISIVKSTSNDPKDWHVIEQVKFGKR